MRHRLGNACCQQPLTSRSGKLPAARFARKAKLVETLASTGTILAAKGKVALVMARRPFMF